MPQAMQQSVATRIAEALMYTGNIVCQERCHCNWYRDLAQQFMPFLYGIIGRATETAVFNLASQCQNHTLDSKPKPR